MHLQGFRRCTRIEDRHLGEPSEEPAVLFSLTRMGPWIIGYHQPIVYFVPEWKATGAGKNPTSSGRFRLESYHDTEGDWPWKYVDAPFRARPVLLQGSFA